MSLMQSNFFDNRSLINHFQSHFNEDGTLNAIVHVHSFASSANGTNLVSSSSQFTHSSPLPVNARSATGYLGPHAWQSVSPNPPNLSLAGNYQVPTLLHNSLQLRGPSLTLKHQSYLSPSNSHSAISRGTFASQPNKSSNFHSRYASQPTGPPNFHCPVSPITAVMVTSQSTQLSNFHIPLSSDASTSQAIRQSNFCSPIRLCDFASQSTAHSTSTRTLIRSARKNEVECPFCGCMKPYIMQLEQPMEEMTMLGHNDEGGNNINHDKLDLTLKL